MKMINTNAYGLQSIYDTAIKFSFIHFVQLWAS